MSPNAAAPRSGTLSSLDQGPALGHRTDRGLPGSLGGAQRQRFRSLVLPPVAYRNGIHLHHHCHARLRDRLAYLFLRAAGQSCADWRSPVQRWADRFCPPDVLLRHAGFCDPRQRAKIHFFLAGGTLSGRYWHAGHCHPPLGAAKSTQVSLSGAWWWTWFMSPSSIGWCCSNPNWCRFSSFPAEGSQGSRSVSNILLVALNMAAAFLFYRHARNGAKFDAGSLFVAAAVTALSELSLTLYSSVSEVTTFAGHVFKIIAYFFIYRAVFIESVRRPFEALSTALQHEKHLLKEQRLLRQHFRYAR